MFTFPCAVMFGRDWWGVSERGLKSEEEVEPLDLPIEDGFFRLHVNYYLDRTNLKLHSLNHINDFVYRLKSNSISILTH